jgi:hypothetical protein
MTGLFTHFSAITEIKVLSCWSQVKSLQTQLKQVVVDAEKFGVLNKAETAFSGTLIATCSSGILY